MSETKRPNPISEMSVNTKLLVAHILDVAPDALVPYAELEGVISEPVQANKGSGKGYRALQAARNHLLFQHGRWCVTIINEGIRWSRGSEVVDEAVAVAVRVRRATRKAKLKLMTADYDSLSPDDKIKHNTYLTLVSFIEQTTRAPAIKRIEAGVRAAQSELPDRDAIKALFP